MNPFLQFQIDNAKALPLRPANCRETNEKAHHVQGIPRTELGEKLLRLRSRVENSGIKLLSLEELRAEVRERRGERG